jgi:hypothetical protein
LGQAKNFFLQIGDEGVVRGDIRDHFVLFDDAGGVGGQKIDKLRWEDLGNDFELQQNVLQEGGDHRPDDTQETGRKDSWGQGEESVNNVSGLVQSVATNGGVVAQQFGSPRVVRANEGHKQAVEAHKAFGPLWIGRI